MTAHCPDALGRIRAEIDSIDDQILRLVERRLAASSSVAAAKNDGRLRLRPGRQAQIVARLSAAAETAPPGLIGALWRELMGHGLQAQARTELVLCGDGDRALLEAQARRHFGSAYPLSWAFGHRTCVGPGSDRDQDR